MFGTFFSEQNSQRSGGAGDETEAHQIVCISSHGTRSIRIGIGHDLCLDDLPVKHRLDLNQLLFPNLYLKSRPNQLVVIEQVEIIGIRSYAYYLEIAVLFAYSFVFLAVRFEHQGVSGQRGAAFVTEIPVDDRLARLLVGHPVIPITPGIVETPRITELRVDVRRALFDFEIGDSDSQGVLRINPEGYQLAVVFRGFRIHIGRKDAVEAAESPLKRCFQQTVGSVLHIRIQAVIAGGFSDDLPIKGNDI